ncbi:MAG: DUF58 domain-containing protein [Oscillospiraceae bacterium]|nr:DUF58 domain-containing protein [Oscillospiraceae bacterium]
MEIIALLIIVFIVIFTETAVYRKYALYGIKYRVYLSKTEAYEGDEIEIIEEVTNNKLLPVPWLKSEIFTSRWLDFVGTKANTAANTRFVPSVFALRPYQKCVRTWRVKCLKRGVFSLEDTSIVTCDIFGFVTRSVNIKVNETVTVLPRPVYYVKSDFSYKLFYGNAITRRFICDDPFIISGAREYSGFEPVSRIHWNSTARENRLMVYNNDYTTENTVLVIMNMQRREGGNVVPALPNDIELYIKITAAILDTCASSGFRSGFAASGGNQFGFTEFPADKIYSHIEILRGLAALDEQECYIDICDTINRINFKNYTDIVIITSFLSKRLLKTANRLNQAGLNVIFYSDRFEDTENEQEHSQYKILPIKRK